MNKNQVKGAAHEVKGKAKESVGRTVGNDKLKRDGELEHAKGSIQKAAGEVRNNIKKATT